MATVTVYEPCACEACEAGRRWFECRAPKVLATFECAGFDGMKEIPHPHHVAMIEHDNPGKLLVYSAVGREYDRARQEALARIARGLPCCDLNGRHATEEV